MGSHWWIATANPSAGSTEVHHWDHWAVSSSGDVFSLSIYRLPARPILKEQFDRSREPGFGQSPGNVSVIPAIGALWNRREVAIGALRGGRMQRVDETIDDQ
jgi:hypothetical protein